jgi:hypothetical protein
LKTIEWVLVVVYAGVLVATCYWLVTTLASAVEATWNLHRFRKKLQGALNDANLTWEDVCKVVANSGISKQAAYLEISSLQCELIVGRHKDDPQGSRRKLLDSLAAAYELEEPFEGLPSETRLSLERIRKSLGTNTEALHPLTTHFKELLKHNNAVNKRQRFYTFAGFLVGVLGFGYGVYISVYPFTPDTAGAVQSKAQVELSERS